MVPSAAGADGNAGGRVDQRIPLRQVRLEEPESLVGLAAHLREEVWRVGVAKARGLVDRLAYRGAEGRERARERLKMLRPRGDRQRIRPQSRAWTDRLQRALGGAAERRDPLRDQVDELPRVVGDLVEELVKRDEVRPFHVPVRLLRLQGEVDGERKIIPEQDTADMGRLARLIQ